MKSTTQPRVELISFCGLYCPECPKYKKEKCPGCMEYTKATWCKIRTCCLSKQISSCADCDEYATVKECRKFNSLFGKIMERVFNSNRPAAIEMIKETGYENFARYMSGNNMITLPRNKKKE